MWRAWTGVRGKGKALIDYRHIIGSLVRKPRAFARYRFREQLYPTHTFRLAYDAMCGWKGERADVDYVRILQLAAPASPEIPEIELSGEVDLGVYDKLLAGGAR